MIKNIKTTLLKHNIDINMDTTINNTIYGYVGVYGEPYDCNIEIKNEKIIMICFDDFEAMNEIQNIITALQKDNHNTFDVEYNAGRDIKEWKFTITLTKY